MNQRIILVFSIYWFALQVNAGPTTGSSYVPPPPGPYQSKALSELRPQNEVMDLSAANSEAKVPEQLSPQVSPLMRPMQQPWLTRPGQLRSAMPNYGYNRRSVPMQMAPRAQQRPYFFNQNPTVPMDYYGSNNSIYGYPQGGRQGGSYGAPGNVPGNQFMQKQMPNRQMNQAPVWNNFRVPMSNYPQFNQQPEGSGSR